MHCMRPLACAIFCVFCASIKLPAAAITLEVNFASGTLFSSSTDAQAKAAINAAAADISAAITCSLNAVTSDVYMGSYLSTTATFDWGFNYSDPSTGSTAVVETATVAADTISLYVGTRSFPGSTLGAGGPGSLGWSIGATGFPSQSPIAIDNAETLSEQGLSRGAGPHVGTASGVWNWSGYTDNYSIDFGIYSGSLSLDNDASTYWHYNHETPVASGTNDLYSVALHEIIHAIGLGTSESWNDLASGTTWNGAEVLALTGSGANLVSGGHIANNTMSIRISDGEEQEVLMDSNITVGTRKELTLLDLAFLRDIGYDTVTPTFPPDFDGDNDVDGSDLAIWKAGYGVNSMGDTNEDGDTDGADFLRWQQEYSGPLLVATATTIPEPNTTILYLAAWILLPKILARSRNGCSVRVRSSSL